MQTFPAVTWSGDRQDCAHSVMLSFADWGQTYSACDMTSPDATVLLRQYQYAALFPVMRAHQMHGVPRFPFLWSEATHGVAFRHALELRYHLLPYIYSLAHDARRRHRPIARRASYEFPHDPKASTQYMLGNALLVGDIGAIENDGGKKTGAENASSVYLPTLESSSTSSTSSRYYCRLIACLRTLAYPGVPCLLTSFLLLLPSCTVRQCAGIHLTQQRAALWAARRSRKRLRLMRS